MGTVLCAFVRGGCSGSCDSSSPGNDGSGETCVAWMSLKGDDVRARVRGNRIRACYWKLDSYQTDDKVEGKRMVMVRAGASVWGMLRKGPVE